MVEYIEKEAAQKIICGWCGVCKSPTVCDLMHCDDICPQFAQIPAADVRPVPEGGIGEMSDGYHTFNGLYYQRMVLFAALVKAHKDKAWKSWRHEDGELCFGGGWFIVGIDTPEGSYTYHYEGKDWDRFECEELLVAKHWDGHTEKDVTRLLSLDVRHVVLCKDCRLYGKCATEDVFRFAGLEEENRFCGAGRIKTNAGTDGEARRLRKQLALNELGYPYDLQNREG